MLNRYRTHQFSFLVVLCLISFTCSLWLGLQISSVVNAQSPNANQLVQQGIERYQAVDLKGAIVRENLARAYLQLGQPEQAISYWNQVISYDRMILKVGQECNMVLYQFKLQSKCSLGGIHRHDYYRCQMDN